jgi:hypothetical protein
MARTAQDSRLVFAESCQEPAEGLDHAFDGADGGDWISSNIHTVVRVFDDDGFAGRRHLHLLQHDRVEVRIGRADNEQ